MVKSDDSFRSRRGRRGRPTLHHLREIGSAKKLERHSPSSSTLITYSSSSVRQRVCRCSRSIRTISTYRDSLSGLHAIKTERLIVCTSVHHGCATCLSSA